jgi:hypothetical protein
MRYVTIILAVAFGMILCWIMMLNPGEVLVRLDTDAMRWVRPAIWPMPLWQVIVISVAIGMAIGFLLTWGSGVEDRRRLRTMDYDKEVAAAEDDEPDYVVGLSSRRR